MPEAHAETLRGCGACSSMVICRACCRSGRRPWIPILTRILRSVSHMVSRAAPLREPALALKPARSLSTTIARCAPPAATVSPATTASLSAPSAAITSAAQTTSDPLHSCLDFVHQQRSTRDQGTPTPGIAHPLSGCSHPLPCPSATNKCQDCASMPL